jgi:RNA polymerase sigma-70 factor (ECF subfamily)
MVIAEQSSLVEQFVAARHHVLGFVLALTRSIDVADEVVQELSVQVLREAERGATPADPFAWMLGMARHRVADHYRARTRDQRNLQRLLALAEAMEVAFVENPPNLSGTGADGSDDARLPHLHACLGHLSDKVRAMLDARYRHSTRIEQIAARLGWTAGSVKVALAKARRALGECVRRKLASARAGGADE